jgi:signal transduction histidine kinase
VIAIAAVAIASVTLFAIPLAVVIRRNYRDQELSKLSRDAIAATRLVDLASASRDPIELPTGTDRLAVYNRAGQRVAGNGPARADALVVRAIKTGRPADAEQGDLLLTAAPILSRERVTGAVRAARSTTALESRVHSTWWRLAGLAAAIILLALLAALWLARRLTRPLERLAAAARRLGEGDFATRAPRSGDRELDAVAEALDMTAARLDELLSRERAFSADASHQLRTPLAALSLELEALALRGEQSPELTSALRGAERLQTTVETLLAVARDTQHGTATADLRPVLHEVQQAWHGPLAEQARPLRVIVEAEHPVVQASPAVVREILDVLLSNACVHGAGAVTVHVRDTGDWIATDVSDAGAAIELSGDDLFVRRSGGGDGHGIGLALAHSLAHAEGGRLSLASRGPGPVFSLVLRAAR